MSRHRTTARGLFVLTLMLLSAGSAAAQATPDAGAPAVPQLVFPVVGKAVYFDDFGLGGRCSTSKIRMGLPNEVIPLSA